MNCLIYLRVSTMEQVEKGLHEDGYSINAQREACLKFIEDSGWYFVDEYSDRGESARSADRPQLQEMLSRVKKDPSIDAVIIHKIDRLARDTDDFSAIKILFKKQNVNLVSVMERIEDSASGRLLEGMHALIAEYFSQNLSHEAKKGMLQKAKQGDWPQMAPIGYLNNKVYIQGREISNIMVDPARAPIITEAFKLYATGLYPISKLHEKVTQMGLKTRPTRKWTEQPIAKSTLNAILVNKFYTGDFDWKGVEYKGNHEPLIDKETFQKVQEILAINRVGVKTSKHDHFLKGTVFCKCGARMSVDIAKKDYTYFYCLSRKSKPKCTMPYVEVYNIEKNIEAFYEQIELKQEWVDKITKSFKKELLAREKADYKQRELAHKRMETLQKQKVRIVNAYVNGVFDDETAKAKRLEIEKDMANARKLLDAISIKTEMLEKRLSITIQMARNCGTLYKKLNEENKRLLNQVVFEKVYINKDGTVARAEFTPLFHCLFVSKKFELDKFGSPDRIRTTKRPLAKDTSDLFLLHLGLFLYHSKH